MITAASVVRRGRAQEAYRPFTLTVDLHAPRIVVSYRGPSPAENGKAERLITLQGPRARAVMPALLELLHGAGYSLPRLEARGRGRFRLGEWLGARVVLLLWALEPVQKPGRAALIRAGILSMVDEEVLYWYAKALVDRRAAWRRRQNALKALRVLLAGE